MSDQVIGIVLLVLSVAVPLATHRLVETGDKSGMGSFLIVCSIIFAIFVGIMGLSMVGGSDPGVSP